VSPGDLRRGRTRRFWRSFRDLAATPLLMIAAFGLLAAVTIVADQTHAVGLLGDVRDAASHVVGAQASTTALQVVAGALVTITSITFSVLLLAVQQTASTLSPVVLDQFIRRKTNQAYLGFFVGLSVFSFVTMAAVQDKTPPVLGATVAVLLTIAALLILLMLVYSTIDQMRPTNVVRTIHDRTLAARQQEADLVRSTRSETASGFDVAAIYRSQETGYLTHVDLHHLTRALEGTEDTEICLHVSLGDHVSSGDTVASVRDGDVDRAEAVARKVAAGLTVSAKRDLAHDPTTGIDQLGNIAWTSGSTAKQNPEVARAALYALEDLAARWLTGEGTAEPARRRSAPLAIVYREDAVGRLLDVFYSMLVAAQESHQHAFAAAVLEVYARLLDKAPDPVAERLLRDLADGRDLLDAIPDSPQLRRARRAVDRAGTGRRGPLLGTPLDGVGRGAPDREGSLR
jgi:uncharacterized membrane protein